jgi:nitric oxide reductase NorD protein
VVSDGLPYDTGYEDTYAEQDVRHALAEAEEHGVGCVCLSVGSASKKEVLERVWGNVGHATLKTPADLNRYAEPLFRTAIRRATVGGSRNRQSRVEHV